MQQSWTWDEIYEEAKRACDGGVEMHKRRLHAAAKARITYGIALLDFLLNQAPQVMRTDETPEMLNRISYASALRAEAIKHSIRYNNR